MRNSRIELHPSLTKRPKGDVIKRTDFKTTPRIIDKSARQRIACRVFYDVSVEGRPSIGSGNGRLKSCLNRVNNTKLFKLNAMSEPVKTPTKPRSRWIANQ